MRSANLRSGFTGGSRRQGGWIMAAATVVTALVGASSAKKKRDADKKAQQAAIDASDPYAPYRDQAAKDLNALTFDTVKDTPEFKARAIAAERMMAAQGYTGSGNAIYAAAEAGGASYQQAFDNLARKAGIDKQPGYGHNPAASMASSQQYMDNMSGAANSLIYAGSQLFGNFQGNGAGAGGSSAASGNPYKGSSPGKG